MEGVITREHVVCTGVGSDGPKILLVRMAYQKSNKNLDKIYLPILYLLNNYKNLIWLLGAYGPSRTCTRSASERACY
jgi:hypothetical protein